MSFELLLSGPFFYWLRDSLTVVFIRETPAVCAETDQLPSLLLLARGDHNDWLFLALKL
jgi:hypothetical protein